MTQRNHKTFSNENAHTSSPIEQVSDLVDMNVEQTNARVPLETAKAPGIVDSTVPFDNSESYIGV
jgi:hypothetical protein